MLMKRQKTEKIGHKIEIACLAARPLASLSAFARNDYAHYGAVKREGFTLIELLVMIAIVGMLLALLVPSITSSQDRARESICVNNMRQIGIGSNIYFDEYNGKVPTANDTKRYIDDKRVYMCPNDKRQNLDGVNVFSYEVWGLTKFDYENGNAERSITANRSETALFVETTKTNPTNPEDFPRFAPEPGGSSGDLSFRHRSNDRVVILFCDNHALSIGTNQTASLLAQALAPGK